MPKITPADELAHIRAKITRLKRREAALRRMITGTTGTETGGQRHRVEITATPIRRFDATLLPDAIRDDPQFWRDGIIRTIRCVAKPAPACVFRPGWPIHTTRGAVGLHCA